jgi:hypothetical protein
MLRQIIISRSGSPIALSVSPSNTAAASDETSRRMAFPFPPKGNFVGSMPRNRGVAFEPA